MLLRLVFQQLEASLHFAPLMFDHAAYDKHPPATGSIALAILDTQNTDIGEVLKTSSSYIPPMNTVILSNCNNSSLINLWRNQGFERIVSMDAPFSELLLCLQHAKEGKAFHCSTIKDLTKKSKRGSLSVRENEVYELLIKGSTNKNIALLLGVGEKSIHTYRKRLMEKLSCNSLAELILYAQQSHKFK